MLVKYDPDKIPPIFEYAEDHLKAHVVGVENENVKNVNICDCCGYNVVSNKLSVYSGLGQDKIIIKL